MARTREEFIRRWRYHLAGLALNGAVSEARANTPEGHRDRVVRVYDIPAEVEKLLGMLWEDLQEPKPPNGSKK